MPSIKKRIGYLPSPSIQKVITKISTKEKLSQSKVVDILVEEALIARGLFGAKNKQLSISKNSYEIENKIDSSSYKFNDLDELISDKGITYNKRNHKRNSNPISFERSESYNEELFEQFKQFMLFQKMAENNK